MDLSLAKKLRCKLKKIATQSVRVVEGNHMVCNHICQDYTWSMNGKNFSTGVMLISLDSCDMVLGIEWLTALGPVYQDLQKIEDGIHLR